MNHKKFIQLLNLYIDGEASPGEVREVEFEIGSDPACRRIYDDYRRIQVATRALSAQFQNSAENRQPKVVLSGEGAFSGSRAGYGFRRGLAWAGGAAAACMAVALAFWSLPRVGGPQHQNQTAGTTRVNPPVAAPVSVAATEGASNSFVAPFAATERADPYLVQHIGGRRQDPFVLSPVVRTSGFGDSDLVLTPVVDSGAGPMVPASWPIDADRVAEQNRKFQEILRRGLDADRQQQDAGPYVPVNLRH